MEVRVRSIIKPFAYASAVLVERFGISTNFLTLLLYSLSLLSFIIFYLLFQNPYSYGLIPVALVAVFLTGFIDEVIRELDKLHNVMAVRFVDKYIDVVIIFGALKYLNDRVYEVGRASIHMSSTQHLMLGGAIVLGIILLESSYKRIVREPYSAGFDALSERMLILTGFMLAGYASKAFENFLVLGISTLCAFIYIAVIRNIWKISGMELKKLVGPLKRLVRGMASLIIFIYRALKEVKRRAEERAPKVVQEEAKVSHRESMPTHNFRVVVLEAESDRPVQNARVTLISKEDGKREERYTNTEGRSDFFDVVEGQHTVSIEAGGFRSVEYDRYISTDSGEIFKLSIPSLDLSVIINNGIKALPIQGATVTLETKHEEYTKTTDALGVAYFENLKEPECRITAYAKGYLSASSKVNIRKQNMTSLNLKKEGKKIELLEKLGDSTLVEYSSSSKVTGVVLEIAGKYVKIGRDVVIISSSSNTENYKGTEARVIDFNSIKPENFDSIFAGMSAGSVMIFEPLSEMIKSRGLESAYRFISKAIEYFASEGLCFIVLLDKEGREEEEVSKFRNLFINNAEIKGEKLVFR